MIPRDAITRTYGFAGRGEPRAALDVEIANVDVSWTGTTFSLRTKTNVESLSLRAIGEVFAENAAAAWLGAIAMGAAEDAALAAIANALAPPGRFEVVYERPYVVIDYAHTPDALARTCRTARDLAARDDGELTVVFGAGGNRDRTKRAHMGRAARIANRVIVTSDNPRDEEPGVIANAVLEGLEGLDARAEVELDRRAAIRRAVAQARTNDVVLVCGKGHETTQTIRGRETHFSDVEVALAAARSR